MPSSNLAAFGDNTLQFLRQLQRNNNREWFQKNKPRYESDVLEPSLEFIRQFSAPLKKISPYFVASDKRVGGSLMRVYRDTRFAKDKRPYKTNIGIQFRHELGKDVHAPGFYLHIEPRECFLGVGLWHPESAALAKIRAAIDAQPTKWKRARDDKRFRGQFDLAGDSLKTGPRGFDKDHPLVADLRRKDFIAVQQFPADAILDAAFPDDVAASFTASKPFMRFLCDALTIPF